MPPPTRIGLSGTGFVARGVFAALARRPEFAVTGVLTRRPVAQSKDAFPEALLTNSAEALAERADIVFECSGDTLHAAEVLTTAGAAGCRLVTLCAEAQVTVGTALLSRGFSVTEAHGDQPGAFAALDREARAMDFAPLAYVNLKGFHDPDPSPESMAFWAAKHLYARRRACARRALAVCLAVERCSLPPKGAALSMTMVWGRRGDVPRISAASSACASCASRLRRRVTAAHPRRRRCRG